jgi:small subunit ribosomal protein S1
VRWDELQGFVPASQLRDITMFECDQPREDKLARWVGEELELKIIELDKERNRLVFSERATIWGPHDGEVLLKHIKAGETLRGQVSNLCDFGAFVDLGGVDGLIHLSELSWRRITHPRELLTIGQQVDVYVIDVDREDQRVALSIKRLRPNPWTTVNANYHLGQDVDAVVTNVVDFGVFAQIDDGLEGLVHISELAEIEVHHPSEVAKVGDQVKVRIVRIDSASHRLGLSMRQALQTDNPAT